MEQRKHRPPADAVIRRTNRREVPARPLWSPRLECAANRKSHAHGWYRTCCRGKGRTCRRQPLGGVSSRIIWSALWRRDLRQVAIGGFRGTYPDQRRRYFTLRNAKRTLGHACPATARRPNRQRPPRPPGPLPPARLPTLPASSPRGTTCPPTSAPPSPPWPIRSPQRHVVDLLFRRRSARAARPSIVKEGDDEVDEDTGARGPRRRGRLPRLLRPLPRPRDGWRSLMRGPFRDAREPRLEPGDRGPLVAVGTGLADVELDEVAVPVSRRHPVRRPRAVPRASSRQPPQQPVKPDLLQDRPDRPPPGAATGRAGVQDALRGWTCGTETYRNRNRHRVPERWQIAANPHLTLAGSVVYCAHCKTSVFCNDSRG